MAQAPAANPTDDLLSQLAAGEIDRLLAEADEAPSADPLPPPTASIADSPDADAEALSTPVVSNESLAEGSEKQALLQAAGFESDTKIPAASPDAPPADAGENPVGDERSALLKAAGFESIDEAIQDVPVPIFGLDAETAERPEKPLPIYFMPLVWINAPLAACSEKTRHALGYIGIATFANSAAVLIYLLVHHKH
jgi:hypothetical protein